METTEPSAKENASPLVALRKFLGVALRFGVSGGIIF
jgi:hypothetical protein